MVSELTTNLDYKNWLVDLKKQFRQTQIKATVKVNSTLLSFYWHLGSEIVKKQEGNHWGQGVIKQLSLDLMREFPQTKGFSKRNLESISQWYSFWSVGTIAQQAVAQLFLIPWSHNLKIIAKCKNTTQALYYVQSTQQYGWSRSVLVHQIESQLFEREGKALTNFEQTLPPLQSDLAKQTLKDPYIFDFLSLTGDYNKCRAAFMGEQG